ncbi:carboxylesterase family protein [Aquirufa rosea]|uniref:Phospholipase n=1 Tax=Aquirufa rosea TaxID=2509241 RepID=A0A4V1M590_9BACT|nr:prolyl oligopeptidase family serine peptidase [Aquirufa rosea]RXK47520.1 phospholipase [Aquirufa rosea]
MKKLLFVLFALSFSLTAFSQAKFEKKVLEFGPDQSLPYQIMYPENMVKGKKYPVLLFLHGAGERGNDNEKQLTHGSKLFVDPAFQAKYQAIVIFPQCPANSYWSTVKIDRNTKPTTFVFEYPKEPNWPLAAAVSLVKTLVKEKVADKKRLYIMGLSMGGMGTFEAISRNPKLFAVAAPICGGADLHFVKKYAKKLPLWVFHGDVDAVVPVKHSREAVAALKEAGAQPIYTEYPGVNHNSWDNAFKEPELLPWIFSHKK